MVLFKQLFFMLLIFQSQLYCSSFLNFFKKSPETLNSDFFNGKIKLTDLFQRTLDKINNKDEKDAIIVKMNTYLKKCTSPEKELFIEIVNQTVPKGILIAKSGFAEVLDRTVEDSIRFHEAYKKDNWISVLNDSSSVKIAKETDFNILKEKLSILFKSALSGNEVALQRIKDVVAVNKISKLSDEQKRDILKLLQDTTERYLHHVNDTAQDKNEQVMSLDLDMDAMPIKLRSISHAQTANSRAVFKYSKDIFNELEPMCSTSQRLLYSIDRQNINPVINMVDMKHLGLNKVESLNDLSSALEKEADRLQSEGKIQIPKHSESRPIFMSALQDKVLGYNKDYVEDQADKTYQKFQKASDDEKADVIREHYRSRPSYEAGFVTEQIHNRLQKKLIGHSQSLDKLHAEL